MKSQQLKPQLLALFTPSKRVLTLPDFIGAAPGVSIYLVWGVLMGLVHEKRLQMLTSGEESGRGCWFREV